MKLVLCRAEVQEVQGYFGALRYKNVLLPAGPAALYDQLASLKRQTQVITHLTCALKVLQRADFFYPGGDGVCFPPQEASGDGPDLVLDLIHDDSFGTDP